MLLRLFLLGACLASLFLGGMALSGDTVTLSANATATARQVEFVITFNPNETSTLAAEQFLTLRMPKPWAHANSGLNDVQCKLSLVTRLFRADAALYHETNTFTVSEAEVLYAGVELEEPLKVTEGEPVHIICVLNMPKSPQAATTAELLSGAIPSLSPVGPAVLEAVVEDVVDVDAIDYSFTLNAKGPLTWSAYRSLGFFGALISDDAVPTGLVFSKQQILTAVYDPASKSLAATLRLYPSRDTTPTAALARLRLPKTAEELSDYLRDARGFSLRAVDEPVRTNADGTCFNGVHDGTESDTDCGGGRCAACLVKKSCTADADCWTGVCSPKTHKCTNSAGTVVASLALVLLLTFIAVIAS